MTTTWAWSSEEIDKKDETHLNMHLRPTITDLCFMLNLHMYTNIKMIRQHLVDWDKLLRVYVLCKDSTALAIILHLEFHIWGLGLGTGLC